MQHFSSPNVVYLEDTEFDHQGRLRTTVLNPITYKPYFSDLTVVMIQGVYCGYCTEFKPIFQRLADEFAGQIDFATIQTDGKTPGEQIWNGPDALTMILGKPIQGVPMVVRFYQGVPVDEFTGPRTYEGLRAYLKN